MRRLSRSVSTGQTVSPQSQPANSEGKQDVSRENSAVDFSKVSCQVHSPCPPPLPRLAVLFVHQRWHSAVGVFQRLGYVGNGHRGILTPGTQLVYRNVGVGKAPIAGLFSACESSSSIIDVFVFASPLPGCTD